MNTAGLLEKFEQREMTAYELAEALADLGGDLDADLVRAHLTDDEWLLIKRHVHDMARSVGAIDLREDLFRITHADQRTRWSQAAGRLGQVGQ